MSTRPGIPNVRSGNISQALQRVVESVNTLLGVYGSPGRALLVGDLLKLGVLQLTPRGELTLNSQLASLGNALTKFTAPMGDGVATQFDIVHNIGTRGVVVSVFETASPYEVVYPDTVSHLTESTVRINFAAAPSLNQYTAVIIG